MEEPILSIANHRYVVYPIQYPALWEMYKKSVDSFWRPEEIDLRVDLVHWEKLLTEPERNLVARILAFFATADGIVAENLVERFCRDVTIPEAKFFYGFQLAMENIHAETYSMLLENLIVDSEKRKALLEAATTVPTIAAKNAWALKWIENSVVSFATRLAAFVAVEGLFFSSSFAYIFFLKSQGKMNGLGFSNELIARDEGMHTAFASLLFSHLHFRPPSDLVHEMFKEAVDIEIRFAADALSGPIPGMTIHEMAEFIRFSADQLLRTLGYDPIYGDRNPFMFMTMISLPGRANFFEKQNSDYRLPRVDATAVRTGQW
ncbi:ferritin-like superfamily [Ephemerocybe angulata]|uniref:Ferritin-like superfamily n=1 Tax=Ephemerocybe angulata TaxID=980116 RepID=A0A8H6I3D0_9AGAR|nr:ferritin-like superfamily [Tulosesus angulatus]